MHPFPESQGSSLSRPVCRVFAVAGFFVSACLVCASTGSLPGNKRVPDFREIDQEEGVRRMEAFRRQRLKGDFFFRFDLVHLPRRGERAVYEGCMWGSWNERGPVSRILLVPPPTPEAESSGAGVELLVQNGPAAQAWFRRGEAGAFDELNGPERFEPILPGIPYSAFDLQMPFIFWDTFVYEGPGRALGRTAQQFLMIPPEGGDAVNAGIGSVRLVLDQNYNALLRVDVNGLSGEDRGSFRVRKFKRVQEQWIVRTIDLLDPDSRSRTRFEVRAAATGISLDSCIFDPDTMEPLPAFPPESLIEEL